jgi:thiol-disulfide isomerase/thioredoxin
MLNPKVSLLSLFCFFSLNFSWAQGWNLADPEGLQDFIEYYKSLTEGSAIDTEFPDISEFEFDGERFSAEDLKKKLVVINIWFVGCTGCKQEEPYLKKLTEEFSRNEEVLFLSLVMSSPQKIERYFSRRGNFGYRTASVDRNWVKEKVNIITSPTHFIVKNGFLKEKITLPLAQKETVNWYRSRIMSFLN